MQRFQNSEMFKNFFEGSSDPCLLIENNHFIMCNQAAVIMLGAESVEQVINAHPSKISPDSKHPPPKVGAFKIVTRSKRFVQKII
jgi:PAS domain-containing protein